MFICTGDNGQCASYCEDIELEIEGPGGYSYSDTFAPGDYCQQPLVWFISDIMCGTYTITANIYCLDDFGQMYLANSDEEEVHLSMVEQTDLILIAPIYDGDKWYPGGHMCPHTCNGYTVDCSGFVTQLLRRLARTTESGVYPIQHCASFQWDGSGRVHDIQWSQIQKGDIIIWGIVNEWGHIAIYSGEGVDLTHVKVWECSGAQGVGEHEVNIVPRMTPYAWNDCDVFEPCDCQGD
jgi:hypothetical protein